jgi:hypothetical protein
MTEGSPCCQIGGDCAAEAAPDDSLWIMTGEREKHSKLLKGEEVHPVLNYWDGIKAQTLEVAQVKLQWWLSLNTDVELISNSRI